MSRIKKTGESIKRKLDQKKNEITTYGVHIEPEDQEKFIINPKQAMTVKQDASKTAKQQAGKRKVTFYIPIEIEGKLNEVYARKMMKNEKEDKSSIISRAIDLLWKEEKNYDL